MKVKPAIIIGLLCLLMGKTHGQDWKQYEAKWIVFPSIGVHNAISGMLPGKPTDMLLHYQDNSAYLQLLSCGWFFHRRWGIAMDMRILFPMSSPYIAENFGEYVVSDHEDEYYITEEDANHMDDGGFAGQWLLSAVYRVESGRFLMYPKLGIGITHYNTISMGYYMKEKLSNTVLRVDYAPTKKRAARMTLSASAIAGYRISRRGIINLELGFTYFNHSNGFTKTTTDLHTGDTYTESLPGFDDNVLNFSGGIGFAYILNSM